MVALQEVALVDPLRPVAEAFADVGQAARADVLSTTGASRLPVGSTAADAALLSPARARSHPQETGPVPMPQSSPSTTAVGVAGIAPAAAAAARDASGLPAGPVRPLRDGVVDGLPAARAGLYARLVAAC